MPKSHISFLFLPILLALTLADTQAANVPTRDHAARLVFAAAAPKVLQIRVVLKATESQASIGSGFIVSADGHVISNYHVVSQYAMYPDRYRMEYVDAGGRRGALRLITLDVVNDLAVLTMDTAPKAWFRLGAPRLRQGEAVLSMGHPLDLGLTIVEGTYNGRVRNSVHPRLHFTGALNAGMSGGPALTRAGEVFGINVSVDREGQLVSFLVPVALARELLRAPPLPSSDDSERFRASVSSQLLVYQDQTMRARLARPLERVRLGRYLAPNRLDPGMRCWGRTNEESRRTYEIATHSCSSDDALFVSGALDTGYVEFDHRLFHDRSLGRLRFYNLYQQRFEPGSRYGDKDELTRFACQDDFVDHSGLLLRTVLCLRAYRRLPGLYDLELRVATLGRDNEGLQSRLFLAGVDRAQGLALARRYLEAIAWQP